MKKNKGILTDKKYELLEKLRLKAEGLLDREDIGQNQLQSVELQKLFHEVQVYQLELEMQNDELSIVALALEEQKARLTNLFEMAPVGYLVLNSRGVITDVNQAGIKMFGLYKQKLLLTMLHSLVHPDDTGLYHTFFKRILAYPEEQSCQLRFRKGNGEFFYAQVNGSGVDVNKVAPSYYITLIDITDKKKAELKISASKKHLEIALDASSTGIWEVDVSTGQVNLDAFSCSICGIEPHEFNGRYNSMLNLVIPDDRERIDAALRSAIVREKEFMAEFSLNTPDGSLRYVLARGQIVYDDVSRRLVGTITNITQKKMLEQEAIRLNKNQQLMITAAALQAEENERKRISETLHDSVGQMLYAIKLNFQQLKAVQNNPYYEQASQLLDQTIRDVRNIAFELAPSILNDFGLATTLEEMAKRLSGKSLQVYTAITGISNKLVEDFALNIYRIIQELVGNSIKHAQPTKIGVELTGKNGQIEIVVKNNGKGFNADYQTAPITGSGLSSIRNRINLYQGKMDIQSTVNNGSVIRILLKQP